MRLPLPAQLFVATLGAPPKASGEGTTCVCHTQCGASWGHRELHVKPQWGYHPPHSAQRFVAP
eukprot:2456730-Pyramimonas_sp.AAC.1